jgi:DNA-binding transcriptional ArsR family regulator
MPNQLAQLDSVFHSLSDPTRRAVLERLSRSPAPVKELAQRFDMALPSFTQHLNVLAAAGLVKSRKSGRVRTYQLVPKPLNTAQHWLAAQRTHWESRLNQLDSYLTTIAKENT